MGTTFSGTDMEDLEKKIETNPFYLSLIVNNAWKPSAKISFIIEKKEISTFSYKLSEYKTITNTKEEPLKQDKCYIALNVEEVQVNNKIHPAVLNVYKNWLKDKTSLPSFFKNLEPEFEAASKEEYVAPEWMIKAIQDMEADYNKPKAFAETANTGFISKIPPKFNLGQPSTTTKQSKLNFNVEPFERTNDKFKKVCPYCLGTNLKRDSILGTYNCKECGEEDVPYEQFTVEELVAAKTLTLNPLDTIIKMWNDEVTILLTRIRLDDMLGEVDKYEEFMLLEYSDVESNLSLELAKRDIMDDTIAITATTSLIYKAALEAEKFNLNNIYEYLTDLLIDIDGIEDNTF